MSIRNYPLDALTGGPEMKTIKCVGAYGQHLHDESNYLPKSFPVEKPVAPIATQIVLRKI